MSDLRRECWECRHRRLVCDLQKPTCVKCRKRGVACPGYSRDKPLRFVVNGERLPRRRKAIPRESISATSQQVSILCRDQSLLTLGVKLCTDEDDLCDGQRYVIELNRGWFQDTILEQCLPPPKIKDEAQEVQVEPSVSPLLDLMTTRVYALSYYLSRSAAEIPRHSATQLKIRLLHHKATTINMLNTHLDDRDTRDKGKWVGVVFCLALAEIVSEQEPIWQPHAKAVATLARDDRFLNQPLFCYYLYSSLMNTIMANTTSPSSSQLFPMLHLQRLTWLEQQNLIFNYPAFAAPWPLLAQLPRINVLRCQRQSTTVSEFAAVIQDIHQFSPMQWAATNRSGKYEMLWVLLGRIAQQSILIFAEASLAVVGGKDASQVHVDNCVFASRDQIFLLLSQVPEQAVVKMSLIWPAIVAGYAACDGSIEQRNFVRNWLSRSADELGLHSIRRALAKLEAYWCSGSKGWDTCFDQANAFVC